MKIKGRPSLLKRYFYSIVHRLELVPGTKGSASWLVVESKWMMVPRGKDGVSFHWECRLRRTTQCPAKLTSILDPDGKHRVASMANPHWCQQSEVFVLEHKFRTRMKHLAETSSEWKYSKSFDEEKEKLLESIGEVSLRESLERVLPSKKIFRSSSSRARRAQIEKVKREDLTKELFVNKHSENMVSD